MMPFSEQLRSAREKAGLSVAAAAKLARTSPRTWAYWESGERTPPFERDAITQEGLIRLLTDALIPKE